MTGQKYEFKAEVKELLNLMIHSLYSHKEIFLRELISNASDAIDKARYESLTKSEIIDKAGPWKILITRDKDKGILKVSDNGIGMTGDELVEALGTIAHSGTADFLKALQDKSGRPDLIGQFGVGFYSAFMVADKVTVISKKAAMEGAKAAVWESAADGQFTVEEGDKETVGTDVVLYLKEEEKKYIEEWEVRSIIKRYSDYIEYPVVMEVEKAREVDGKKVTSTEEERINSGKAIWLRDKSEVSSEEYNEFYRHISHESGDAAKVIHYKAEGTSEFTALLYIPSRAPFGMFYKDYKIGPALYVRRVQIMDHCEQLIPEYLRFIKGVVDSSDLPLNVSREMLQGNRQVEVIKKSVVKKVLDTLAEMKKDEYEAYLNFYKEFGRVLKEGIHYDFSRKEQIADLLLFHSSKTGTEKFVALQDYLNSMPLAQEDIYYITATAYDEAMQSPYLEAFREKGYEVLIMLDEIDDIIMGGLFEYKGKKLRSVVKGDIDLEKDSTAEKEKAKGEFEKLIDYVREILRDDVKDVRLSGRLKDSACCLVTEEGGLDPKMEKILTAMGQEVPAAKRILEINPSHPVLGIMKDILEKEGKAPVLREYAGLLYDQALLLEGARPKDPASFVKSVAKLMVDNARQGAA